VAIYPRPVEHTLDIRREPVDGVCSACSSRALARYPVHSEGGWFLTTRCQVCLWQAHRERWNLHGPVEFLSEQIERY
jgi:hypothetical protein